MRNKYLHLIACLLLPVVSGGRTLDQGSAKPDTLFSKPYVDLEGWRDQPVRHYYVHGGSNSCLPGDIPRLVDDR